MPMVLQPLPRRIRRTHENFTLGRPVALSVPAGVPETVVAILEESLEPLFPEIRPDGSTDPAAAELRFALPDRLEEAPPEVTDQAYRIEVSPDRIEVTATSETGWLLAVRQLPGLREGDELAGIEILDWPSFAVRQIDLAWPGAGISAATFETIMALLAVGRLNRLGLPGGPEGPDIPQEIRERAQRLGIEWSSARADPSFALIDRPSLFPRYSERLPALKVAAHEAEANSRPEFVVSLGSVDAQTSLESLAYGILFAGDCTWNARKTDLKAFRRTYALRRFGFDSRAPQQIMDALETGASLAGGTVEGTDDDRQLVDPFDTALSGGLTRPESQAAELEKQASAAMAAMVPLQPDTEERAAALQGLQWAAQRLKARGRLIGTVERVRELYRAAYVAAASPKALSDRLLRAADLLENEARSLDEHRGEWHALWRRERRGPYDPDTEAALRAPGAVLLARAARLRELRNRYIQTGALPSPAEEGLERTACRLTAGIVPSRLPPQPSPAWWPEGGAARMRVDVDCPAEAAGHPWAVEADFRALAGEAGAFNVRSARLVPLTETDEAGPERPCQLLRTGFAFMAEPGNRTYYLYLDPEPAGASVFRDARASQSSRSTRLENRRMRVSLSSSTGFIAAWQLDDPEVDLLAEASPSDAAPDGPPREWRLRLIETGPLLARARAEHPDGRIRQFDLGAGRSWIELSANAPEEELLFTLREELWAGMPDWCLGKEDRVENGSLQAPVAGEAGWGGLRAAGGLVVGVVLPEGTAEFRLASNELRIRGAGCSHWLLYADREDDAGQALQNAAAALRRPPRVRLGIFEHRRVREF